MFIKPPTTLLVGVPGSGKSRSLATAIEAGLELRVVLTESSGLDTILDTMRQLKLPMEKLRYHIVSPVAPGWKGLESMFSTIKSFNYEDMTKMKSGVDKETAARGMALLDAFRDFVDVRTGEHFGDATEWDDSVMLALDSLSGINLICRQHTVGYKPTMHEGEWGVAMEMEKAIIKQLVDECKCYFTLTAHVDREPDQITGGFISTASALGRKNAPQIIKDFSEVVHTRRSKNQFYWSTSETNMDVKNRALPIADNLLPHFKQIVDVHEARKTQAE